MSLVRFPLVPLQRQPLVAMQAAVSFSAGTQFRHKLGQSNLPKLLISHRFFSKAYLSFPPRSSSLRSLLRRRRHFMPPNKDATPYPIRVKLTSEVMCTMFWRQSLIVWEFNVSQECVLRVSDFRTLFWHRPNHLFHATRHHRIL